MSAPKHTPGPWKCVSGNSGRNFHRIAIRQEVPSKKGDQSTIASVTIDADATLIAAAPDLLAVCQELEESASYWSEYDVPVGIFHRLKKAITKATGK